MDARVMEIATKGWNREPITKEECVYVLGFGERSLESFYILSVADLFMRKASDNTAILNAQIGIQTGPCPGNCRFCGFNMTASDAKRCLLDESDVEHYIRRITEHSDVRTISLMTMHDFDMDHLARSVRLARRLCPDVAITINTGDLTYDQCVELRRAGATGAYHACRLREGIDTDLDPEARLRTIRNCLDAGLMVSTCTEPIGPEHTAEEIVDNFFASMETGADSGSVMARVPVDGTPLCGMGVLSVDRIAQIRAILLLASTSHVKESQIDMWGTGFFCGYNRFTAEYGGNPRDPEEMSEDGQGHTIEHARATAFRQMYDRILGPGGRTVALDFDYLMRTGSI